MGERERKFESINHQFPVSIGGGTDLDSSGGSHSFVRSSIRIFWWSREEKPLSMLESEVLEAELIE